MDKYPPIKSLLIPFFSFAMPFNMIFEGVMFFGFMVINTENVNLYSVLFGVSVFYLKP